MEEQRRLPENFQCSFYIEIKMSHAMAARDLTRNLYGYNSGSYFPKMTWGAITKKQA